MNKKTKLVHNLSWRGEIMESGINEIRTTGVEINYLFVCKRKLWFYTHNITMEQNSQRVEIGKEVHDNSLNSKKSEMMIDETIRIDYIDNELAIHEIKMSKAMEDASMYQILYYIYYLRNKGVDCRKGVVHFPKTRKTEDIIYDEKYDKQINDIIKQVQIIKEMKSPPDVEQTKKCKKCSYYELCFC